MYRCKLPQCDMLLQLTQVTPGIIRKTMRSKKQRSKTRDGNPELS